MKRWLVRFFGLFPFFDLHEYERQAKVERIAWQEVQRIRQQNFMERELMRGRMRR